MSEANIRTIKNPECIFWLARSMDSANDSDHSSWQYALHLSQHQTFSMPKILVSANEECLGTIWLRDFLNLSKDHLHTIGKLNSAFSSCWTLAICLRS